MYKNYIKYLFVGLVLVALGSCKKNNVVMDKDPIIPPEAARFLPTISTDVFWVAPGTSVYKIPIGVTTVSNVDRQVALTYTSTTGAGAAQYTAPATETIKAGSTIDTLTITGLYAGYSASTPRNLKITIGSGAVKANSY